MWQWLVGEGRWGGVRGRGEGDDRCWQKDDDRSEGRPPGVSTVISLRARSPHAEDESCVCRSVGGGGGGLGEFEEGDDLGQGRPSGTS